MDEDKFDNEELAEFFNEMKVALDDIKALALHHGYADSFVMTFVCGVYMPPLKEGEGMRLAAAAEFVVDGEEELEELLSCAEDIYSATENTNLPHQLKDTREWTDADWVRFMTQHNKGDKGGDTNKTDLN